jgi:hypothetical protein
MSRTFRRNLAMASCAILQHLLPQQLQPWGWAVRNEVAEIQDDSEALLFALEGLLGLVPRAVTIHLRSILARLKRTSASLSRGGIDMGFFDNMVDRPRRAGIASAFGAVMLGLAYMTMAGAPMAYLAVNAGAFVMGLMVLALLGRVTEKVDMQSGATTLILAFALLATALFGDRVEGAARWVDLGAVFVQPSLILLPFMIVSFVHSRNALSTTGLLIAAMALALQPDRAMAGMLLAGLATITVFRRDRFAATALIGSAIGFAATLAQADALPAVPFVDHILYTSFDISFFAGLAVAGGAILLVVPAVLGWASDKGNLQTYCVFGAVWLAAIAAAALGNYPTPVVGYSGGAVLGYVLSLAMLPKVARSRLERHRTAGQDDVNAQPTNQNFQIAAGYPA